MELVRTHYIASQLVVLVLVLSSHFPATYYIDPGDAAAAARGGPGAAESLWYVSPRVARLANDFKI